MGADRPHGGSSGGQLQFDIGRFEGTSPRLELASDPRQTTGRDPPKTEDQNGDETPDDQALHQNSPLKCRKLHGQ